MPSYKELLEKNGIAPSGLKTGSYREKVAASKTQTNPYKTGSYEELISEMADQRGVTVGLPSVSDELNRWLNRAYYTTININSGDREKYTTSFGGRHMTDAQELIDSFGEVERYLEQNKQYLQDPDGAKTLLSETLKGLEDAVSYGDRINKYYQQWENAQAYNDYLEAEKIREEMLSFDLEAERGELDALKERFDLARASGAGSQFGEIMRSISEAFGADPQHTRSSSDMAVDMLKEALGKDYSSYDELAKDYTQREQYYTQAQRLQDSTALRDAAVNAPDFVRMYLAGRNMESDLKYDSLGKTAYHYMNEEEAKIYNYYLSKFGEDKAMEYVESIRDTLDMREAQGIFGDMDDKPALEYLFGAIAGVDQFASGMQSIVRGGDYTPPSSIQYASQMVREDLGDKGFKLPEFMGVDENGNRTSVGQVAYDLVNTSANMLPSILVSSAVGMINPVAGTVAGTALLGASASGNAYADMVRLGYSKDQARSYAAMVGASEAGLQLIIGGITKLGGLAPNGITEAILKNVDNAFARTAIKLGGSMAGEFTEEYLQEILTPWFENLALHAGNDMEFFTPEALYSGLLGALTAGILEGGSTVASEVGVYRTGSNLQQKDISAERLANIGKTFAADTVAYKIASRVNENTGAYTMGRLFNEIGATLSEQNKSDIRQALVSKGVYGRDADVLTNALSRVVEGGSLSSREASVIEANPALADVVREVIIDPNSTVYQRTTGYNDALRALAGEMVGETKPAAQDKAQEQKRDPMADIIPEGKRALAASEGGQTVRKDTKEPVTIKRISSIKDGKMTIELENGDMVDSTDLSYATEGEALVYEAVANMGVTATEAEMLIREFKNGDVDAESYARGISEAYTYGRLNIPEQEMVNRGAFSLDLNDVQRNTAYKLGKVFGRRDTAVKVARQQKKTKGVVTDPSLPDASPKTGLSDRQKVSVRTLNSLSKSIGVEFRYFKSYVNNKGQRVYKDTSGVERSAPNGLYVSGTGVIYIDLNAGQNGEQTILFTAAHELTHFIRDWDENKFKALANFLFEQYGEKGVSVDELIQAQIRKAKANGRDVSYDEAYEEVVADSMQTMLADGKVAEKLALLKAKDETLWAKIRDFFKDLSEKIRAAYEKMTPNSREAQYVSEMADAIDRLQELFTEGLASASENFQSAGIMIDAESKSAAPVFSERTWTESEYVQDREKAAKALVSSLGVDIQTAYRYIDDINGVARMIADDRVRLDYEPNMDAGATVLKPNSEYKYSVDMSTLCAKRLLFTGTFDAIQKAMPNTVFDSEDIVGLRKMMEERGYEVACGICYVESTRREIGRITQEFIDRYKEAQKTGKPISRINSKGEAVTLTSKGQTFMTEEGYTPTLGELNTTDIDIVKRDHRGVYDAYLAFMNARGQAKPKLLETRAEYKGEILKHFKAKSAVNARNKAGGLRLQSFSDFEIPHLIDMMQVVMDMARVGLKSQAYTKVPAFADAFGNTGVKINLSLIAKGSGVDSKGNLIFDDVEGMDHKEAFRLREKFSENVGTILVGKTDEHIIAALADPRIDFVIPFHKSSWKESLYDALGLTGYSDYTDYQNEKSIDPDREIKNFAPSEYWDYSKTGDENAQIYLEKCREDGRIPKFPQFQGYPGYWKLLIDFKMYDNNGVGAPQNVVQPIFSQETNQKILDGYEGNHRAFPIAKDVVDDFVEKHKAAKESEGSVAVKYSDRETLSQAADSIETISDDDYLEAKEKYPFVLVMNHTPKVVIDSIAGDMNASDRRVIIRRDALYLAIREGGVQKGHYHGLGKEVLKKLPEYLEKPDVILKTDGSDRKRILLASIPVKGGQGIISVEFESMKDFDGAYEYFNVIVTVFDLHKNYLKGLFKKHNAEIKYEKEDLAQVNPQLYEWLRIFNAKSSENKIAQDDDGVKRSDRDPEPVSNRDILANALESAAQNSIELKKIREYKAKIAEINAEDAKLTELNKQIQELSFAKGPRDKAKIRTLRDEAIKSANRISIYDKQLLRLEASTALKNLLEREKVEARKAGEARGKKALDEYRTSVIAKQADDLRQIRALNETVRGLKDDSRIMEREFIRLAREYEKKAAAAERDSGRSAVKISDLRSALMAEAKSHKEDQKIWEREFNRLLREYDFYGRKISRLEETVERQRKTAKAKVESRSNTELRHKIQRVVKELNDYLLKGNKDKHVPEELQAAVAEALDVVNMDTVGADNRIAALQEKLLKAKTAEEAEKIAKSIERIREQGGNLQARLGKLKAAYEKIKVSSDPVTVNAYDEMISEKVDEVVDLVGNTPLRDMNKEQLSAVYDLYKMVLTTVRQANKAFKAEKGKSIAIMANNVMQEVRSTGGLKKLQMEKGKGVTKFLWNNFKPVYAFRYIGSKTLSSLFDNVRAGEDVWARDVTDAKAFFRQQAKAYRYDKWNFDKQYKFESSSEMEFSLSLEQIMSLYAYSKREQAHDHILRGGIVFDSSTKIVKKVLGVPVTFNPSEATAYNISAETLMEIVGKLTAEQRAFVDAMQGYLSTVMGDKGNEVSMEMYGVKLFKEENYFPLKSADQYLPENKQKGDATPKIKNKGFTKTTVTKANNPIVLTPFMDVWADHVNDMSMYHAFVLPMEDFYRVYNFNTPRDEKMATESVQSFIQNAYGDDATNYIKDLLRDLSGGAVVDPRESVFNAMIGTYKKAAVFASASVAIQQPSAIARAAAVIDRKYMIGPRIDKVKHKVLWEEVKKYAPVAVIKEMGYFDTNMGRSARDFIQAKEYGDISEKAKALITDGDYRDEKLSRIPALMDELSWCVIWEGVKRETKAKRPDLKVNSEQFLQACGKRFTEVIVRTQVYDSVLSRSGNMRAKGGLTSMITAFLAEPTTTANIMTDALVQGKRGDRAYARTAIGAVIAAQIFNAFLRAFTDAERDDDKDETYWEKYLAALLLNILEGINPLEWYPVTRDVMSVVKGYSVERSDMSIIEDVISSLKQLDSEKITPYRKVENFVGSVFNLFGLPLKNVMREVRVAWNTFVNNPAKGVDSTKSGVRYALQSSMPKWLGGGEVSNGQQLYESILRGDTEHAERVRSRYKDQSAVDSAIVSALRDNDPRIKEAAVAKFNEDLAGYESIAREIIDEGFFSQTYVVRAVNAEISKMEEDEGSGSSKEKALFTAADFGIAITNGDTDMADTIREEIIRTAVANGKSEESAADSFEDTANGKIGDLFEAGSIDFDEAVDALMEYAGKSREDAEETVVKWEFKLESGVSYSDRDEAYKAGLITASELRSILMSAGGMTGEEADYEIMKLDWQNEVPGIDDITVEAIKRYNEYCRDAGISREVYYRAWSSFNDTESDKDPVTGESIRNTKMHKVFAQINGLPLTPDQKTALAMSFDYSATSIAKYKLW